MHVQPRAEILTSSADRKKDDVISAQQRTQYATPAATWMTSQMMLAMEAANSTQPRPCTATNALPPLHVHYR